MLLVATDRGVHREFVFSNHYPIGSRLYYSSNEKEYSNQNSLRESGALLDHFSF